MAYVCKNSFVVFKVTLKLCLLQALLRYTLRYAGQRSSVGKPILKYIKSILNFLNNARFLPICRKRKNICRQKVFYVRNIV